MDFDVTVVGAGVVGLAVAEALSKVFGRVLVIDKEEGFGRGVSSRNSEVIHAGIYYLQGSLKARLCVSGRELLYGFCERHRVPHRRCGKLIVATCAEEIAELDRLEANARACGVTDLERLTWAQVRAMEPNVRAREALYSPSTGIVSAHGLMRKLFARAKKAGTLFSFETEAVAVETEASGSRLTVRYRDGRQEAVTTGLLINAAGLFSDRVAGFMGLPPETAALHWWKGEYAALDLPAGHLTTLVYPVPEPANQGLGTHATLGLDGTVRLGPNALYLPDKEEDYRVDPSHLADFHRAASRYLKGIAPSILRPDMAGIRPKRQKPNDPAADFLIHSDPLKGHVHLIGIESPGLTASLAIAREVCALIGG
ncbi:NAD(P)/FAD-dependent oxidoreductase [Desulfoluna spongiiphila]|uniref:L-2-hydroxyglutarate oxidase LhgO n=1 Tax=Desulfoluna spongiiphila TaxID=419481 RepID=A0A1G5JFI8_9BACT|nr:NAD(P)/FAD-dependent oxidoreductase [Desulfoluna spongiiphila]SCY86488.1 L-2-hydroxyglutarate oxidase LhgO [Desulfoluna spongiiphila]